MSNIIENTFVPRAPKSPKHNRHDRIMSIKHMMNPLIYFICASGRRNLLKQARIPKTPRPDTREKAVNSCFSVCNTNWTIEDALLLSNAFALGL